MNIVIENKKEKFLFARGVAELKWIFQYPWISERNRPLSQKYPFSSVSKLFYYQTVKVFKKNKLAGVFIFSVNEGHLKTLFFWLPKNLEKDTAAFLKNYCVKNKIEVITIYHSGVAKQLIHRKFPFLYVKEFGQKIYSSFKINDLEHHRFQDGDGDRAFT